MKSEKIVNSPQKIVSIISFGCKVNSYEAACIGDDFAQKYKVIPYFTEKASVFVVNSCTVTARAGAKCRQTIRKILRLKQADQRIVLVVTGCLANLEAERIRALGDVDYVLSDKSQIFAVLQKKSAPTASEKKPAKYIEQTTSQMFGKTRAFVKIQDGCNFFCAYCIIPYARGVPVFRSPQKVLQQIELLVKNGYSEIVLGGINIGLYACDGWSLQDLLFAIEKIKGLDKIRISSIEPQHLASIWDFICKSKKLAHHLHIPLQSGSGKVLQAMGRRYLTQDFTEIVQSLKKLDSHFAIGCDVIIGFPGESERDFSNCYDFIAALPISYLHIFPYSLRAGTKAAKMPSHISASQKKKRASILSELAEEKKKQFAQKLLDDKVVLSAQLEQKKGDFAVGVSDYYVNVYLQNLPADGRRLKVIGKELFRDGLLAEVVDFAAERDDRDDFLRRVHDFFTFHIKKVALLLKTT